MSQSDTHQAKHDGEQGGRQGRIEGQRWRGKPRDCLSPRAGEGQREPARRRGKPRDCLSQGPGKNKESLQGGAAGRAIVYPKGRGRTKRACKEARQAARLSIPRAWEGPVSGDSATLLRHFPTLPKPLGAGTLCSSPALGGRHSLFFPGPWGAGPLCPSPALGGALLSCPACPPAWLHL